MQSQNEEVRVTIAALLNLIRLMGAELVVGTRRDDLCSLEAAMRRKVFAVNTAEFSSGAVAEGLAEALRLVEQVIVRIRKQAETHPNNEPAARRRSPAFH